MKSLFKKLIPSFLFKVECNICGSRFRQPFADFGTIPRKNARCYSCGSLERHRILWKFLQEETDYLKRPVKLLHIAPEACLYQQFDKRPNIDYHCGDLSPDSYAGKVQRMDITDLPFSENFFDLIICNHVLEHVIDDRKAMREIYRVLKLGGMAVLMTPINTYPKPEQYREDETYEDFTLITTEQRAKAFGQEDHVRVYGTDFKERLQSVGFTYEEFKYHNKLPYERVFRYGMQSGDPVQFGLK